jgi:hypothetical protein
MKPHPRIFTVPFLLLISACPKDAIDVGTIDVDSGISIDAAQTGGTTTGRGGVVGSGGIGSGGVGTTGGVGGGAGSLKCMRSSLVANEANNYEISTTFSFPLITAKPKTDLTFDWSNTTVDLTRHPIDPKMEIDLVTIAMFDMTPAELQTKMKNADTLKASELTVVPITYVTNNSKLSAKLSEFMLNGNPIDSATILSYFDADFYSPKNHTYALMVSTGTAIGQGTRMIQMFHLDPTTENTTVQMKSDSTRLTFYTDLRSFTPTAIAAGETAITFDWGSMTKNALGNDFLSGQITSAYIGHYTETVSELEGDKFLDLDRIAIDLYRAAIPSGDMVDFSSMKTAGGKSFTGIDGTGTWLLGLQCGNCRNPVPWYLTVLKPCSDL